MDKLVAKRQIAKLIEDYKERINEKHYHEAQARKDFIEPLFEYLGWDMRNRKDANEVTTEESVSGGRVDLAFRINGIPVMFLEAKPFKKIDLDDPKWAEQVINYCWNRGVTWAVLTDFETLQVFNSDFRPFNRISSRLFKLDSGEYIDDFDKLWLLSKDSFEGGHIDEWAKKHDKLAQKLFVSDKLFEDLTLWRRNLTNAFRKLNDISEEELDEGVQRILDRFIFIRTAEDRRLNDRLLLHAIRDWEKSERKKNLYNQLIKIFRQMDEWYNSELFSHHYSETWKADDEFFAKIINKLYRDENGYEYDFSVISADVLGGIYEQYLGYVQGRIKKEVREERIWEKRKSQAIFFTPSYVVDFIVNETLGPLLRRTELKDVHKIKVLDPACGSGSFLIAAYSKILEKIENGRPQVELFERFNILKDNIYGVDIDEQAIQISRLNLLLRVLNEKASMPTLGHNLRVGNSLLSFGDNNLKPFDWKEEFKDVFDTSGFNVIIGNPPYIKEYVNKAAFDGLHNSSYYQGKMDIWTLFACQAIDLLKEGGYFSFIAPNNWPNNSGASIFRKKILSEGKIIKYIDFGDYKVFPDAGIQTMIFIFQKLISPKTYNIHYAKVTDKNVEKEKLADFLASGFKKSIAGIRSHKVEILPEKIKNNKLFFSSGRLNEILDKINKRKNFFLLDHEIIQGIVGDPDKAFIFPNDKNYTKRELAVLKRHYTSVCRFSSGESKGLIAYLTKRIQNLKFMPNIQKQIEKYIKQLKKRREVKNKRIEYFHLHWPRDERFFEEGPKIVCAIRTAKPSCFYTEEEYYGSRALNFIKTDRIDMKYLTGLLNSELALFWLKNRGKQLGDQLQVDKGPLMNIPIYKGSDNEQKIVINLVEKLMELGKQYIEMPIHTERWKQIDTDISRLERKIDEEIYNLYRVTAGERKIIEEGLKNQ